MTPEPELRRLYDDVLAPRIRRLDHQRKAVARSMTGALLAVVLLLFALETCAGALGARSPVLPLGIAGLLVGAAIAVYRRTQGGGDSSWGSFRARFKKEIASEIFRVVCPGASYEPDRGVARGAFDESGLFTTRVDRYRSEDRVRGRIGATPFEAGEVTASYTKGRGKKRRTYDVFRGLFLRLDFNKHIRGRTLVQPEGAPSWRIGDRGGLSPVRLESPDFEHVFSVYASDPVQARYVLTPLLMDRIVELAARSDHPPFLAFVGSHVHLAFHVGRELFEPLLMATASYETVREIAEDFSLAETIVRELDLNTRIWTKGEGEKSWED